MPHAPKNADFAHVMAELITWVLIGVMIVSRKRQGLDGELKL